MDLDRATVTTPGGVVHALQPRPYKLLEYLIAHPDIPHSRSQLLAEIWGVDSEAGTRAVDSAIARLRAVIEPWPNTPTVILTRSGGLGYLLAGGALAPGAAPAPDSGAVPTPGAAPAPGSLPTPVPAPAPAPAVAR